MSLYNTIFINHYNILMTNSAEEYLEKKVRGLIEPMISSLLMERPKEPVTILLLRFSL